MWSYFMVSLLALGLSTRAYAIPTKITYQGTLKEKSLPVNATKNMRFRITNQQGTQVYWSSNDIAIKVTNGLFSQELDPTGVNWQAITPYIEVAIEGQTLTPREPLNASIYAVMSSDIVDGVVTSAKLASSVQDKLIPSGMIAMFGGPCPNGWTRFASLDDRFPMGASSAGGLGGSNTHYHLISPHAHGVSNNGMAIAIGIRNVDYDNFLVIQPGGGVGSYSATTAGSWYGYGNAMGHPAPTGTNSGNVPVSGPKITGTTDLTVQGAAGQTNPPTSMESSIPPYVKVVYCQKN